MRPPWIVRAAIFAGLALIVVFALLIFGLSWTANVFGIVAPMGTVAFALLSVGTGPATGWQAPRTLRERGEPLAAEADLDHFPSLELTHVFYDANDEVDAAVEGSRWMRREGSSLDWHEVLGVLADDSRIGQLYALHVADAESAHVLAQAATRGLPLATSPQGTCALPCAVGDWRQTETFDEWILRELTRQGLGALPPGQRRQAASAFLSSGRIIPVLVASSDELRRVLQAHTFLTAVMCVWDLPAHERIASTTGSSNTPLGVPTALEMFTSGTDLWSVLWSRRRAGDSGAGGWTSHDVRAYHEFYRTFARSPFSILHVTTLIPWWMSDAGRLLLIYLTIHWSLSFNLFAFVMFPLYDPWAYALAFSLLAVAVRDPGAASGLHREMIVPLRVPRMRPDSALRWHTTAASVRISLLLGSVVTAFELGAVFGDLVGFDVTPDGGLVSPTLLSKFMGVATSIIWGVAAALLVEVTQSLLRRFKSTWMLANSRFANPPEFATLSPVLPRWRLPRTQLIASYAYFLCVFVFASGDARWAGVLLAVALTPALCFGMPARDVPRRSDRLVRPMLRWAVGRGALLTAGVVLAGLSATAITDTASFAHEISTGQWPVFAGLMVVLVLTVVNVGLIVMAVSWLGDRLVLALYLPFRGIRPGLSQTFENLRRRGAMIEFAGRWHVVPSSRLPHRRDAV